MAENVSLKRVMKAGRRTLGAVTLARAGLGAASVNSSYVRFEIPLEAALRRGLRASARLLGVALPVGGGS